MKAKVLFLSVICALQCNSSMQAMGEANQPAQTNAVAAIQPVQAPAEGAAAAIDDRELYIQRALSLLLMRHARCGAGSPVYGLPQHLVQQICDNLKQLMAKQCTFPDCDSTILSEYFRTPEISRRRSSPALPDLNIILLNGKTAG